MNLWFVLPAHLHEEILIRFYLLNAILRRISADIFRLNCVSHLFFLSLILVIFFYFSISCRLDPSEQISGLKKGNCRYCWSQQWTQFSSRKFIYVQIIGKSTILGERNLRSMKCLIEFQTYQFEVTSIDSTRERFSLFFSFFLLGRISVWMYMNMSLCVCLHLKWVSVSSGLWIGTSDG